MATFTWIPDFPAMVEKMPRVLRSQFGDGYEQRVGDGINTINSPWMLTFKSRTDSEIGAIMDFLAARAGVESFDWTNPDGDAGKYVCRTWSKENTAYNINMVSAKFELVYEP